MLMGLYQTHSSCFARSNFSKNKKVLSYYRCNSCFAGDYGVSTIENFIFWWYLCCGRIHSYFCRFSHSRLFKTYNFSPCVQSIWINLICWRFSTLCECLLVTEEFQGIPSDFYYSMAEMLSVYLCICSWFSAGSIWNWLTTASLSVSTSSASASLTL